MKKKYLTFVLNCKGFFIEIFTFFKVNDKCGKLKKLDE